MVIQPKMRDYYNKTHFDYAGAAGGFLDKYGYPYCNGRVYNKVEIYNNQYDKTREIIWACGACFFVRNVVFKKYGGFDVLISNAGAAPGGAIGDVSDKVLRKSF